MRVGVLLSGCGVQDGSEISEAVLTLLALERAGAQIQGIAPDVEQAEVFNHYAGEQARGEPRYVLPEAARIMRGKITSTREVSSHDLDALVIVGGYGAVKNLCSYAADGVNARVNPDCERLIIEMCNLGKPIGAMCAAPILVAAALRESGKSVSLTIGNDAATLNNLAAMGARPVATRVDEIHLDPENRVVTTAAFMLAQTLLEAEPGITALCNHVVKMAQETSVGHDGSVALGRGGSVAV